MTAVVDRATPAPAATVRGGSTLTGTWTLVRFILRRDRVRLSVWAASIIVTYYYFVGALGAMGTEALQARGDVMTTPAGIVMGGPGYGVEHYTIGIAMANEMITWVTAALALMAVLHIVRHTRAEEESSRSELIRSSVVGRHAPAVAAVLTLVMVLAVIAVVSALAMSGANSTELPLHDSIAMTTGVALAALTYGAFAVVACQLTEHPRGATGLSLAFFGVTFALRAAGDLQQRGGSLLSWFSPIGWAQQMRPFYELRWWPVLLAVVLAVVLLVAGSVLASHRDFGAGMIATRAGRADAAPSLRSPWALAWRQQRTAFWCWLVGMAVTWYATGTMLPGITEMGAEGVADNELFAQLFGTEPGAATEAFANGFLAIIVLFIAICFAAYGISAVGRARTEETAGRTEVLLATPVSRTRWFGAQIGVAALGTVVLMLVSTLVLWAGALQAGQTSPGIGEYLQVVVASAAALAVYVGLAAALYAWVPRLTGWAWALVAWTFVIGVFGPVFNAPDQLQWLDPMHWAPASFGPDAGLHVAGFTGLCVVAAALFALAFAGFRRRDVPTT